MATIEELMNFRIQGDSGKWDELSDDIVIDITTQLYCKVFNVTPEQVSVQAELAERIEALALCEKRTSDAIESAANEIAEKYELPYGMALPALSGENAHYPILAHGTPLSHIDMPHNTELAQQLRQRRKLSVRNSWEQLGDRSIAVVDSTDGPMAYWEYHSGNRVRKFMDGITARMDSQLSTDAEMKAIELLKSKVTASQFRCYMLNGAFPERSPKSDIHYFFRKGLPVIAISWHGYPGGRILACLCIHPYGYYQFTHAGVMCPTDEVIGQLLLMRANEKKFWAKSGQWGASDPRSGI